MISIIYLCIAIDLLFQVILIISKIIEAKLLPVACKPQN